MTERRLKDVPQASSGSVRRRMSEQARRDTACEMAIRRRLHAEGLRYRVHYPLPGHRRRTIDIAFPAQRVAVFVDGCFWHGCPAHSHQTRSNTDWWLRKIGRNRERDAETNAILSEAGWHVMRVWEHEDSEQAASRIASEIKGRRH